MGGRLSALFTSCLLLNGRGKGVPVCVWVCSALESSALKFEMRVLGTLCHVRSSNKIMACYRTLSGRTEERREGDKKKGTEREIEGELNKVKGQSFSEGADGGKVRRERGG